MGGLLRLHFRIERTGLERVPREGGLLVVSNHLSFADPPLVGWAIPRPVHFLAAAELFRLPLLRWIMPRVSAIPVDRSRVDARATRAAVRCLREGSCVAIFPEGGIRLGPQSVLGGDPEIKPGAAAIAQLGRCAILPVILRNTQTTHEWRNWFRRPRLQVTIGFPFCLWNPPGRGNASLRGDGQVVLREELLKTVALG